MKEKIESIIQYELESMPSGALYPIEKVVSYFGVAAVCQAYGCIKYSVAIAEELVRIAFEEADK